MASAGNTHGATEYVNNLWQPVSRFMACHAVTGRFEINRAIADHLTF